MSYDLLAWNAWARNATPDEIAEKLTQQQAEVARLRSVCRECSGVLMRQYDKMTLDQVQQLPWLSAAIVTVAQDMAACGDGKESK